MDQDIEISSPFMFNNDFLKTKRQERESFWNKLFEKYDIVEDDPGIKIEDIVKVQKYHEEIARYSKRVKVTSHLVKYKRSSIKSTLRKRDRPRSHNSGKNKENSIKIHRKRLNHNIPSNDAILYEIPFEDANESSFKKPAHRKRGRPRLNKTEVKTEIDKPEYVTLNNIRRVDSWDHCEKPRKQGRPRLNNNGTQTEFKPEDVGEPTLIKSGRLKFKYIEDSDDMQSVDSWDNYKIPQKYGKARLNYIKDSDDDVQSVNNLGHCEKPRKRGRPRLNNNTKLENATFTEIKSEDVGEPTSIKSGRPKLEYIEDNDDTQSVDSWDNYKIPQKYGRARLNYIKDSDDDVQSVNNLGHCKKSRKRGRPRLNNNTKLENATFTEIKSEDVGEPTLTKSGRPRFKCIEDNNDDVQIVNNLNHCGKPRKRGRPRLNNNTKNVGEPTSFKSGEPRLKYIKDSNNIQSLNNLDLDHCEKPRKRGRPRLNNNIKLENEIKQEDVAESNGDSIVSNLSNVTVGVCRKRGRPRLNNIKLETKDIDLDEKNMQFEESGRPPLNEIRMNLIKTEVKSEQTRMPGKRGRPRKNFSNSVEDLKVRKRGRPPLKSQKVKLETTCENNYKPKVNQLKPNTIYYVHPLGRKELDNLYPDLIENQQEKFVNDNLFIRQFQRSSIFTTSVKNGDKDEMKTKVLIENKLESDLAYKLFKRHCCQLNPNSDNNSVLFWHNAVKEELLKLSRIVPPEKLAHYMVSSLAERIKVWNADKAKLKDQTVGCSVTV